MVDAVAGVLMAWACYRLSARVWGLAAWRRAVARRSVADG
jgi:hypothetical protein